MFSWRILIGSAIERVFWLCVCVQDFREVKIVDGGDGLHVGGREAGIAIGAVQCEPLFSWFVLRFGSSLAKPDLLILGVFLFVALVFLRN